METKDPIQVVLIDDHPILRSGLKNLLDACRDIEVIGEGGDADQARSLLAELKPTVLVLDLSLPGEGGIEALPALRRVSPDTRVLILSAHADDSYLRLAMETGASGYVPKKAADAELIAAIRAVARGENYVHSSMTSGLLKRAYSEGAVSQPGPEVWAVMSVREQEVLLLVAKGHTNSEIAERLFLSIKTIETYRARGMDKLGLRSRAGLVNLALKLNLLKD